MANNRLYIEDSESGERFLLCKTLGSGWYPSFEMPALEAWLDLRDQSASFGNCGAQPTQLRLVTEMAKP